MGTGLHNRGIGVTWGTVLHDKVRALHNWGTVLHNAAGLNDNIRTMGTALHYIGYLSNLLCGTV